MARAWLLAEMAVHDPEWVFSILEDRVLDVFTHSMTIRKIRESFRITDDQKAAAAALRRKEEKNENHGC